MSGQSTRGALNLTAGDTYGVLCGPKTSVYGDVPECGGPASSTATPAPTQRSARHVRRRHRSLLGRLLAVAARGAHRPQHRRPADGGGSDVGMVPGRLHARQRRHVLRRATRSRRSTAPSASIPRTDPLRFPDYVPHHNPFQYFASTANPQHLPPTSVAMVGKTDQANHLYDLTWFWEAARAGQPARRLVPQGTGLPERAPGQLEPARRAGFPGAHAEPAPANARVAEHGGDHRRPTTPTAGTTT